VLVTGGAGCLGGYIIKELISRGYQVRGIRRKAGLPAFVDPAILQKAEWVEGDVLDVISLEDAMQGVDMVIHSAAVVSFLKKERKQMYQVNVDGTANVANMDWEQIIRKQGNVTQLATMGRS